MNKNIKYSQNFLTSEKVPRQDVYACHEKILDAICKGNHSAAFDAMMEHAQLMTNQL